MTSRYRIASMAIAATLAAGCPAPQAPQPTAAPVTGLPAPAPSRSPSPSPTVRPSPSLNPSVQRRITVRGKGDFAVEGPFTLLAGERTVHCTYEGKTPITVVLIRADGNAETTLFAQAGPIAERVTHQVPQMGTYHLHVTGANGVWLVEIE
jgi:hypothetical protein